MKINIKSLILQEGILDMIKENRGKVGTSVGIAAGAGIHHNYTNSGAKTFGEYTGEKFSQAGEGIKKGFDTAKDSVVDAYKNVSKGFQNNSNNVQPDMSHLNIEA